MQKNVSPVVAIIIILVCLAIVGFAWMKFSAQPPPIQPRGGGGGTKTQATGGERRGERRSQAGRAARRGRRGQRPGQREAAPGGGTKKTETPAATAPKGR